MGTSWIRKKLGEICHKIKAGGTPSRKVLEYWNGDIPFVKIEDISSTNLYLGDTQEKISQKGLENSNAWILPPNSVLFSIYGSIGKVAINKIPVATNQAILGLIPKNEIINHKFLTYSLKAFGKYLISYNIQSTQKNLTLEIVKSFEIPLPPLPIQQKIVKILDTIQEAIDIQEKIIEKVKELKKSLMAELFKYGGPSFRKGRKLKKTEIGEIPEDWEVVRLGEVAREIVYGISKKGEKEGKYPILRMNNLEDGKINCKDLQFVSLESSEFEKFKLEKGDILFNRTNSLDLVGKTALFTLDGDFVFASYLLRIRTIKDQLLPEYLNYYFNFEKTQQDLKSLASRGASQVNISASKLSSFPIPLPPLSEQREIAEILQTIDQKIEIEKRKKELYEELFKTMLNKIMNQEIDVEKIEV
jgi:type I restriction enzyme S subunit